MAGTVEFFGETLALAESVSEIALMEFAEAADSGGDGDTMEGRAAMFRLVKSCVADDDVKRFLTVARKNRATSAELLEVLKAAFTQVTERPTGLPADSSDGQPTTAPSAGSNSAGKASDRLAGRPDLQLAVARTKAG